MPAPPPASVVDKPLSPGGGNVGRPMRVLVVSGSAELYGSDRVMLESVAALLEGGAEVTVATGAPGPLHDDLEKLGATVLVQASPVLRRAYASPVGLVRFAGVVAATSTGMVSLIRRVRPDVLYVNTMTLPAWAGIGRLCGVPVIVHVHEAEEGRPMPVRRVLATSLRVADHLVFNGETARQLALSDSIGSQPPGTVVLNPVPPLAHTDPPRTTLESPLRVLYMGRISERKGVDVAVEAVARLNSAGADAVIDLVGGIFPGYEPYLEQLTQRAEAPDLRGRVTFHGFQSDVSRFVSQADVVVVPSRADESFGNVLVEAVSSGRPVIAAGQKGLREAGRELASVTFVSPGSVDDMAEALSRITQRWDDVLRESAADAVVVTRRHDPAGYRRRLRTVINEVAARSPEA